MYDSVHESSTAGVQNNVILRLPRCLQIRGVKAVKETPHFSFYIDGTYGGLYRQLAW